MSDKKQTFNLFTVPTIDIIKENSEISIRIKKIAFIAGKLNRRCFASRFSVFADFFLRCAAISLTKYIRKSQACVVKVRCCLLNIRMNIVKCQVERSKSVAEIIYNVRLFER